jgi:glutaredoxin-related protein
VELNLYSPVSLHGVVINYAQVQLVRFTEKSKNFKKKLEMKETRKEIQRKRDMEKVEN